jgi:hypothetical protein
MDEIDIWRTAYVLMTQHGDAAEIVAAQRADELLETRDRLGCLVFTKIRRAIAN